MRRVLETFLIFLRLGLTSFGGPVAHLGYFRTEFVTRRRWLDERAYGDLVALCQFIPGPASSQVGIGLGLLRAGPAGSLAAWLGFTAPSAILMMAAALGFTAFGDIMDAGLLAGLKLATVAVVAQAVIGMGRAHALEPRRLLIAGATGLLLFAFNDPLLQVAALLAAAALGAAIFAHGGGATSELPVRIGRRAGLVALALFAILLVAPWLALLGGAGGWPDFLHGFYRAGSLVFGGGHVVLPLLEADFVETGQVARDSFLAGYAAAQMVPGPLFTFAAYLGGVIDTGAPAALGALLAICAIFLPSFLLVFGLLPFWSALRGKPRAQGALAGVNAAVVGLLAAALVDPVLTSAVHSRLEAAYAFAAVAVLMWFRPPPWAFVPICGLTFAVLVRLA